MTKAEDASSSILMPFNQKWEKPMREQHIKVFFRKRGPRAFTPDCVFVYIAAPVSQIIGRAGVESFSFMRLDKAAKLAPDGGLTERELRYYSSGYAELAVFYLKRFEEAKVPLTFAELSSTYNFGPPQNFLRLSKSGKVQLETALGYARLRTSKAQKNVG
jgi:predicted transcriptional regulator